MAAVLFLTLPGLVILLTVLAIVDQVLLRAGKAGILPWRPGAWQGQVASTGFEQLHAGFSPGKDVELKTRESSLLLLLLRVEDEDGAPPNLTEIDFETGTAVFRARRDAPDPDAG